MGNGKIPLSAGQVIGSYKSVPITNGTEVIIATLQLPSTGYKWLILSRVSMDFTITGTMENTILVDNVIAGRSRTTQTNGGGCMSYAIADPGSLVALRTYVTAGSGNAAGTIQAIRI